MSELANGEHSIIFSKHGVCSYDGISKEIDSALGEFSGLIRISQNPNISWNSTVKILLQSANYLDFSDRGYPRAASSCFRGYPGVCCLRLPAKQFLFSTPIAHMRGSANDDAVDRDKRMFFNRHVSQQSRQFSTVAYGALFRE